MNEARPRGQVSETRSQGPKKPGDRGQRLREPKGQVAGDQGAWGLGARALRTRALGCVYYLIYWLS